MSLKVEPAAKYDGSFPTYYLPVEIGHFSMNYDGKFCNDNHQLKYLVMPNKMQGLHMDLNEGIYEYIDISENSQNDFRMILRWIVTHQEEVKKHFVDRFTSRTKIDFVCFKGTLTKICSTIYNKHEDWSIVAAKYKSTIYLATMKTKREIDNLETMPERGLRMCTWGFKFEQYMTSDTMNSKPTTSAPVNENEKFYTVMKGKFGDYILLLGSELDAVDPAHFEVFGHDPTSVLRNVELKTSRIIESEREDWKFNRFKLLRWYLQSYLVGTLQVICGFRDDDGIVRQLKVYNTRDMPKIAQGSWSPAACLNFGIRFLDFLKQTVVKEYPTATYKFYSQPGSDIICGETRSLHVLTDWYTDNVTFS